MWNWAGPWNGEVAQLANQVELLDDSHPDRALKAGVVDLGGQVGLIRDGQREYVVDEVNELLGGTAAVEAGRAGVADSVTLGPGAVGVNLRPVNGFEEVEVTHRCSFSQLAGERAKLERVEKSVKFKDGAIAPSKHRRNALLRSHVLPLQRKVREWAAGSCCCPLGGLAFHKTPPAGERGFATGAECDVCHLPFGGAGLMKQSRVSSDWLGVDHGAR